jgi:sugar phosphate isomerase/epimerase
MEVPEQMVEQVAQLNEAGEKMAKRGFKFFYHNHHYEFYKNNGQTVYDYMIENAPYINFTLDTYWVQYAGGNPNEWLRKLKGRLECIHLKDMAIDGPTWEHRMAPVGSGNMNFEKIIETAADCDVSYLLVEQDKCYDENPFDCLTKSYKYLTALGLK